MILKAQQKKKIVGQNLEKKLLKNRLSIRVRNFAPLNIYKKVFFIFTLKSPTRRDFMV
jgi:hypothetical protein